MQVLIIVFFVAVGVQLFYLAIFLLAFSRKRLASPAPRTSVAPVSVIVCAHDEEQNLRELIPMLLAQQHPHFEVIIVDDRSNDGTFDMLLEETKKDHRLRMVHVNRTPAHANGKKYAITLGIKAATFEWILLTDADCRPQSTQWIETMSQQFGDKSQFVLGYSPYQKMPGFLNKFIRFESLLTAMQYVSFALLKNPYMGVGRNLAYRKSFFLEKKGFNNFLHVTGGDDDLYVNQYADGKNTAVQILPESHVYSIPQKTLGSYFHQKVRHLKVGGRYRLRHRLVLGLFVVSWILTWFTGLPLAIFGGAYYWFISALVFRSIMLTLTVRTFVKRLGSEFEVWSVPLLDFLYSIYYISTGLAALLTKKIRWKN